MGNDTMSEKYEEEPKSARDTGNVSLNGLQAADQPNRIRMVVTVIENGNIPEALRLSTFLGIAQEPAYRALLLTCIKESQWWRDPTDGYGPYRSFDECAKEVTGLGRSSYGDLIRAWQRWHDKHKKTAEEWMRHCLLIGWAKCRDIGSADIPSDKIDAVVEEISRRGLKGKALTEYLQRYNPNYRSNREQKTNSVQKGPKPKQKETSSPDRSYSIDDILRDGCFLERTKLEKILERLHDKKNLILQGPPGTGKTWLAKRFAFALIGQRDDSRVRAVQFHPNLLYEDFVRGYRPAGDGKLSLADGPFLEVVNTAKDHSASIYVVVIEEINRGNPAQIFGEMLTLLEQTPHPRFLPIRHKKRLRTSFFGRQCQIESKMGCGHHLSVVGIVTTKLVSGYLASVGLLSTDAHSPQARSKSITSVSEVGTPNDFCNLF